MAFETYLTVYVGEDGLEDCSKRVKANRLKDLGRKFHLTHIQIVEQDPPLLEKLPVAYLNGERWHGIERLR